MATFTVVANATFNTNLSGLSNRQGRAKFAATEVLEDASKIRVYLGAIGGSTSISAMYIGHGGVGSWGFDGTQVQVFFSAAAGVTFSGSVWSDWLDYEVDASKPLVVSWMLTSSAVASHNAAWPGRTFGYASTTGTDPALTASGAITASNPVGLVRGIEGDGVAVVRYPVSASLEQRYGGDAGVAGGLVGVYSLVLEATLRQVYGDADLLLGGLVQPYSDASFLQRGLMQPYGDTVAILRALDQRYHLMHLAVAGLDQPYAICGLPVVSGCDQSYDLRARDLIASSLDQHYSLFRDSVVSGLQFSVLVGGVDITHSCSNITWTLSDDAYLIEGTITTPDQAVIRSIAVADVVELTWMGTTYHLFVASKRRASRGISGEFGALEYTVDYLITVRSATAALMDPYALPITMDWPEIILASNIAADIIGGLADIITIDWQVEDWLQPGGTFFLTDEIPLEGLRKLAEIIGAELVTSPDNHLQVVMPDMVAPDLWATTAPARIISDNGQIFSDTEAENERTLYNVVTVSNQGASAQSVRFETEDVSEMVKRVKGFRIPWADIVLAHSGGAWVTIEDEGIKTEQVTETVEIIDGAASASKPVYSQVAARWLQAQLGAITASEDGSLTTKIAGMSLVEITYTTKYHAWLGRDDRSEEVQFYEVQP